MLCGTSCILHVRAWCGHYVAANQCHLLSLKPPHRLTRRVAPVCAQGTDAAHLADCLGLEGSKFGGAQAVVHRDMAADLREEALQVGGPAAVLQSALCWMAALR